MLPWWGKSSSKEAKKKTNKKNFIDTLQCKLKIPSEEKRKIRSGGFQRCSSDIALEKGSQCLVESRSPLPSMHASRCQSFAERPNPQPLPLPTGHSSTGHTATGISMSRSEFEKCGKSPLILPHAKPESIRKRSDAAYADVDLATASVSSGSLIDGDDPADSCLLSPQASDFEIVLRTVANSPSSAMHKDKSPAITRKNSRETLTTAHPFINNKSVSQSPKKGFLSTYPSNVQSTQHGGFETGSAPDSSMSSPSRSPMRAVFLEQIASYAFCSTKPYPDVSMFGSGQCSSQGSGQNSGHNSVGGDMSGQLFWQHSRGSTECSPIPSPRKTSPGPSSRIQSGAVTPLHPRAGGAVPESTSSRPEDGKKQSHRLPLPPLTICNSSPFSPSNSGVTASLPSVPRSPGRVENPSSPGSRWKRGKLIGRGTFGHVYVGFNSESGEMCAMKEVTLFPDDPKSKESAKQLMQEIVLLSRLRHQNIVQYYGSETIDEKLYIYLEYVSGGSIHKLLQDYGQFGELAIRNFTQQILSGLAYLHAKNTVHRDIKGANILVDPNGHVKLADFGMAKHITGQSCSLSFKGSPNWMAPEVIKNSNGCSLAVDIWSLGCTVLEMATAKPPWSQYEGVTALFKIGNSKELPAIPDHLSDDGKDFVKQCLQRNPLQRPTAAQLLEHPFVKNAAPVGGSNARDHSSLDMEGIANHQPAEAKTSPVSREILLPRNLSSPVSPLGSPLLHSKFPQFMNGRTSPSPISSPRTTSGSSTPLSGGSGSIPFHHLQQSAYLHKDFGGNMLMAPNSPHVNGSNYHDSKPNLFQMLLSGSHGLREMMASETDILMKPFGRPVHEDHLEQYYGQSVLADHESQQLSRDHVKSNTSIGFGAGLQCCCPNSLM